MKKHFGCLAVVVAFVLGVAVLFPNNVSSIGGGSSGGGGSSTTATCLGDDINFLAFPTWYRGLECDTNGNIDIQGGEVGPIVFTIALNILDIGLRIAGILAVGFVVFGGFQYMTARGEPENAKKGRDTVIKALIGMGIAMVSAFVVAFVVARLGPLPSTIIQKRHPGIILFSQLVFQ
jgi:hypothetical protein